MADTRTRPEAELIGSHHRLYPTAPRAIRATRISTGNGAAANPHLSGRADEVPPVAGDVEEHRHAAVRLRARRGHELRAGGAHPFMGSVEVVDVQAEPDTAH